MPEPRTERKETEVEEVASTDVRDRLSELMKRAAYGNERFILTLHGQQSVALVNMRDFARLRALDAA